MPDISVTEIAILAGLTIVGVVLGWLLRGMRANKEKAAVSEGWREQINAQRSEHGEMGQLHPQQGRRR